MGETDIGSPEVGSSGETRDQRHNRELIELLNELRVMLPGVQVLFAFLLAVPLSSRFDQISSTDRVLFFVTLLCTAMAAVLLIAPSAIHRIDFRLIDKGAMVVIANRLAIAGTAFVALAMVGALTFISRLLYGGVTSVIVAVCSAAIFGVAWFVMPIRWRRHHATEPRFPDDPVGARRRRR
jgi:hypothetical protein